MCVNEDGEDCCMLLLFEFGNSGRGGITVMSVALFIGVGVRGDEGTVVLLLIIEILKSGMSFRLSG